MSGTNTQYLSNKQKSSPKPDLSNTSPTTISPVYKISYSNSDTPITFKIPPKPKILRIKPDAVKNGASDLSTLQE